MFVKDFSILQIGFENKVYYAMVNNPGLPYNIELDVCQRNFPNLTYIYNIKRDGLPSSLANCSFDPDNCPWPFDCTSRPWYIQGKNAKSRIWTKPFMQVNPTTPTVSLVNPLLDTQGRFLGAIAANVGLLQITTYLKNSYQNTDRNVFIVDALNNYYLIATSLNAKLSTADNKLLPAIQSENSLIAGATKTLIGLGWPTYLVAYNGQFLQSLFYNDSVPGIYWYVVVLLPMDQAIDHLGSDSSYYSAAIALASISLAIILFCTSLAFALRNTKLLKLTRPMFTGVVLTGCALASIYCYFLIGENTDNSCTLRPWLFNIAFTLGFSPFLIKSYMVQRIFNGSQYAKLKVISMPMLMAYTLALVLVDVILICVTVYAAGGGSRATTTTELLPTGAYGAVVHCSTAKNMGFFYAELAYKGLLVAAACVLSYHIRKTPGVIAGTRVLVVVVYNVAVVSAAVIIIASSVTDVRVSIFVTVAGVVCCAIVTALMLIVPLAYQIYRVGDEDAAEEVIDEVFLQATKEREIQEKREKKAKAKADKVASSILAPNGPSFSEMPESKSDLSSKSDKGEASFKGKVVPFDTIKEEET